MSKPSMLPFKFNETVYICHSFLAERKGEGFCVEVGKTRNGSWAHFWVSKSYSKLFSSKEKFAIHTPASNLRIIKANQLFLLVERDSFYTYSFEINSGYRGSCELTLNFGEERLILTPYYVLLSKMRFLERAYITMLIYPILFSPAGKIGSSLGIIISCPSKFQIEIPFLRTGQLERSVETGIIKLIGGRIEVYEQV